MARSRLREVSPDTHLRLDPIHTWTLDLSGLGLLFRAWRVGEASRDMFVATPHWIAETRLFPEKEGEPPRLKYVGAKSRQMAEAHLREEIQTHVNAKATRLREQLARALEAKPPRPPRRRGASPAAPPASAPG